MIHHSHNTSDTDNKSFDLRSSALTFGNNTCMKARNWTLDYLVTYSSNSCCEKIIQILIIADSCSEAPTLLSHISNEVIVFFFFSVSLLFPAGELPPLSGQSVPPIPPAGLPAAVSPPIPPCWRAEWTHSA